MRFASPPAMGIEYKFPKSSKTIVVLSGETSKNIHVPSSEVNSSFRSGLSGRPVSFAFSLS
jgi:hypothetical protein